jgi:ubiquinone/menaquinone biosynthesis C-methylase UbiE
MDDLAQRYSLGLAAAFVRGRLPQTRHLPPLEAVETGRRAGLRLHRFKRTTTLPRVRRVLGLLRSLAPDSLLDVAVSGRGAFLWPLLDAFPELRVHAVDQDARHVADIQAVADGGVARLSAACADAAHLPLPDGAFDGAAVLEVLEHVADPTSVADEALRVARRFVVVSVPSRPDTNPGHVRLFDRAALELLLRGAGARRVSVDFVLNHLIAVALR